MSSVIARRVLSPTKQSPYDTKAVRGVHKRLDAAVFAAYGWQPDLSDEDILEKLLALNLERAQG